MPPLTTPAARRTIHLRPQRGWVRLNLPELWHSRELIAQLALRDIRVRYKQTVLGIAWAVLVPLVQMVVFTLIVAVLFGFKAPEGIPFPLYNFAALVPWTFFAQSVTRSTTSLVSRGALIKKVYLPRMTIPVAAVGTGLIDFLISFTMLLGLLLVFHLLGPVSLGQTTFPEFTWHPGWSLLWVVPMVVLTIMTALGVGLWTSALMVRFRDVGMIMPFVMQMGMYACPIIYSAQEIPESARWVYRLNPMVGVIEGFRWALIGLGRPPAMGTAIAAGMSLILLLTGLMFFRRTESTFADLL